ncbi:hypothetical protein HDU98_009040 [Podochytrium sp. JEL0797]|nr:hypothetical protein HDU98_009040 [Podochytrium sp. JEL0797]
MDNMVSEIQELISSDIEHYVVQSANSLRDVRDLQVSMFEANIWSFLPSRINETMREMLFLLNGLRSYTMDMYSVSVPEGAIFGYHYDATNSLQLWSQVGLTVNSIYCDSNGYPLAIASTSTDYGNGTIANPGNNNTIIYGIGGSSGANINYTSNTSRSITLANPSTRFLRAVRTISTPFVMQLSLIDMGDGHPLLLFQYIDQNAVLSNMQSTSMKTGFIMLGIILLVVGTGTLFALLISRQLRIVGSQISLLKQMKFNQVLGKDGKMQSTSFISELSDVQVLFYEMVVQFANTLKASKSMQQGAMGSLTSAKPKVQRTLSQQDE